MISRDVTVITITRERVDLLPRALASIRQQDYHLGTVFSLIVVDGCEATREWLMAGRASEFPPQWVWVPRGPGTQSGPHRLAYLRNMAVNIASTPLICFLDDDNEYEPNHIQSLVDLSERTSCRAVHSQRAILWRDGTPFLASFWPWSRDSTEAEHEYHKLCSQGVLQPGSNIGRDRADPKGHEDPVLIVDTGEWLLERSLLLEFPFPEDYTREDWLNATTEDDKFLRLIVDAGVDIRCTGLPTLRYYLGGYSNTFDPSNAKWSPPSGDYSDAR